METSTGNRQAELQSMKLRAIVSDHLGGLDDAAALRPTGTFGLGAGLVTGGQAWVLLAERPERGLGPALGWARQAGFPDAITELHVLAETSTGVLARRAAQFDVPVHVGRSTVVRSGRHMPIRCRTWRRSTPGTTRCGR